MRDSKDSLKHGKNRGKLGSGGAYGDHRQPGTVAGGSPVLIELIAIAERLEPEALTDLLAVARGLDRHRNAESSQGSLRPIPDSVMPMEVPDKQAL